MIDEIPGKIGLLDRLDAIRAENREVEQISREIHEAALEMARLAQAALPVNGCLKNSSNPCASLSNPSHCECRVNATVAIRAYLEQCAEMGIVIQKVATTSNYPQILDYFKEIE